MSIKMGHSALIIAFLIAGTGVAQADGGKRALFVFSKCESVRANLKATKYVVSGKASPFAYRCSEQDGALSCVGAPFNDPASIRTASLSRKSIGSGMIRYFGEGTEILVSAAKHTALLSRTGRKGSLLGSTVCAGSYISWAGRGVEPGYEEPDRRTSDLVLNRIKQAFLNQLRGCLFKTAKSDPRIGGITTLRFSIKNNGYLKNYSAEGFHSKVDKCIEERMAKWRFPGGKVVGVVVPILQAPANIPADVAKKFSGGGPKRAVLAAKKVSLSAEQNLVVNVARARRLPAWLHHRDRSIAAKIATLIRAKKQGEADAEWKKLVSRYARNRSAAEIRLVARWIARRAVLAEHKELDDIAFQIGKAVPDRRASSTLGGISEEMSLKLQMAMDRRSKFISTLSNIMKKLSSTQDVLIQNIK